MILVDGCQGDARKLVGGICVFSPKQLVFLTVVKPLLLTHLLFNPSNTQRCHFNNGGGGGHG